MKELRAKRVPPGDRWSIVGGDDEVYSSLTEVLNAIFVQTNSINRILYGCESGGSPYRRWG